MEIPFKKISLWWRNSITVKMLVVGFLFLILLIPLDFAKDLIAERATRKQGVVNEINQKWGNEVVVSGPILKIPYKVWAEKKQFQEKTNTYSTVKEEIIKHAYFLPDDLLIDSQITTQPLSRSIYEAVVFQAKINIEGVFPVIDFKDSGIETNQILWDKATLILQTSNLKGIKNKLAIQFNTDSLSLYPKYDTNYLNNLESKPLGDFFVKNKQENKFSVSMHVNGSQMVSFIPIGKKTVASMDSNWHSPSFTGAFLPEDGSRQISSAGFKAAWQVLQINRQFEQSFFGYLPDLKEFAFGTQLIVPVDEYQKSERTAKYGFLVIGLTLLTFFLIQIISKIYIHPFQYAMIGLALVMFYTLLIAISEHSSFLSAYIVAAFSVLVLITAYSKAILNGVRFPLLIALSLGALYTYIYVIIQMENYALLTGSIGLFLILAIVMFASKKLNLKN